MAYELNIEVDVGLDGRVDVPALHGFVVRVLREDGVEDGAGMSIVISDDAFLHELNLRHRQVDAPTDVLSFPTGEGEEVPELEGVARYLGDSTEEAFSRFTELWAQLRPALTGCEPVPPRIWRA